MGEGVNCLDVAVHIFFLSKGRSINRDGEETVVGGMMIGMVFLLTAKADWRSSSHAQTTCL